MIYVDIVMVLNFAVDFLLILGANSLSGYPPGYRRAAFAAALGGVYGGICLLPGFSFLGGSLWRTVFLVLMALIAFGWDRSALRRGVMFILLSMALGGIAIGLNRKGVASLIAAAAGLCLLCAVGFRGRAFGKVYRKVELVVGDRSRTLMALHDTGNMLRDPVTGLPVLVVGAEVAWELLKLTPNQLATPIETVQKVPGLRLIPYRAVGQPGGMLLAKKPELVRIDGKQWDGIVAFAPQSIGKDGYEALAGGTV